ncbi:hypothetical protein NKH77_52940 [Streptomyces sp. M19]
MDPRAADAETDLSAALSAAPTGPGRALVLRNVDAVAPSRDPPSPGRWTPRRHRAPGSWAHCTARPAYRSPEALFPRSGGGTRPATPSRGPPRPGRLSAATHRRGRGVRA